VDRGEGNQSRDNEGEDGDPTHRRHLSAVGLFQELVEAARQPDAEKANGCTVPYAVARQDQELDASQFHATACTWSIYCITVITVRRQGDSRG